MRVALILLFVVLLFLGGATYCFWGRPTEIYRDKFVAAGEIRRPFQRFAAHVSPRKYLTVLGKTYTGIRGLPPYYLEIPELNSLLFVVEESKEKVTIHVVNLRTKEDVAIDADGSGFGGDIGSGRKPGEQFSEYVERVEPNRVTISKRSLDWKETKVLNLDSKKIEQEETLFYDGNGQVTNRTLMPR